MCGEGIAADQRQGDDMTAYQSLDRATRAADRADRLAAGAVYRLRC